MAAAEALEGTVDRYWFHHDLRNDVLYMRLLTKREEVSHGEETDDGPIVPRSNADDSVVGITVVSWWKRFGPGVVPDSMSGIVRRIGPSVGCR